MNLQHGLNWLHVVAVVVWIGGLIFNLVAFRRQPIQFVEAAQRFKPWTLASILVILLSGFSRVASIGGFKVLPVPVHIKIACGLLMIVIGLIAQFVLLPKATRQITEGPADQSAIRGLVVTSGANILLGLVILALLANLGAL